MSKKTSKQKKQKQKQKSVTAQLLKGKLDVTRSGMGYVVIDNGSGDVLVRPGDFMNALNGDVVRVKVVRENGRTGKKEGKITDLVIEKVLRQIDANRLFFCYCILSALSIHY